MKVAIAGAGTTGAYLYRLLSKEGFQVDIFDRKSHTACGITPCAWGTSRGFVELIRATGLEPEKYILQRVDHVFMNEVRLNGELMTYDKPALEKDLLEGSMIKHGLLRVRGYDRVIDATGMSRAYLPPIENEILLEHWNDSDGYTAAILKEFEWMNKEREVINKLRTAARLNLKDAWVLKKNARRMGMHVELKDAVVLLRALR